MSESPSTRRLGRGPLGAAALALASVVGVALWWSARAAEERRISDALEPWADTPLPMAGAPVDAALAALGARLFERHCAACHAVTGEEKMGPNLAGVSQRRDAEWIRGIILNPDSMTRSDPVAAELKERYQVQMFVVGDVDQVQAHAIIEFLRRVDGQTGG